MDRLYNKPDGNREQEPECPKKETQAQAPLIYKGSSKISSRYTKLEGTNELPTFVVIFSGGTVRERDYFSLIERDKHNEQEQKKFKRINLEFLFKSPKDIYDQNNELVIKENEDGFSPDKLWIFAENWIKERYISKPGQTIELIDSIYLISDVDHFLSELLRIKPLCEAANCKLIISNSCFEKWLYYGYFVEKPHENSKLKFSCPDDVKKISSAFKTYCGKLVLGGLQPKKAILNLEIAIANAKANYSENEDGIPHLHSTNMFILGEELLPLIQADLEIVRQEMETRAMEFRNT